VRVKVVVIDGQGGKMGKAIIERIKSANLSCVLTAIGTNSSATSAMMKAGADDGATGENPVIVASRDADVIIGPIGIIAADSLLGEITPPMAVAVGQSGATKLLLPVNLCNNIIVGTRSMSMANLITEVVEELERLMQ
jgi:prephenate dehydrogenase